MPELIASYHIADRRMRHVYHRTQFMALVPVGVILSMMFAAPRPVALGLWTGLGIVIGSLLLLSGGYRLHTTHDRLSRPGQYLSTRSDAWFPFLLFIVQTVCVLTALYVLWFGLQSLAMPIPAWQNLNALSLSILIPTRIALRELAERHHAPRLQLAADLMVYLAAIPTCLFIAGTLSAAFLSERVAQDKPLPTPVLVIWVPTILVVLSCVVLMVRRLASSQHPDA